MKKVKVLISVVLLFLFSFSLSSDLVDSETNQSDVSMILKKSGSLYLRETHYLSDIESFSDSNIECEVLIVKDLLNSDKNNNIMAVGIQLSIEEEYSERNAFINIEEGRGILASLDKIINDGLAILETPIVNNDDKISSEIHYATKEDVRIAAFINRGTLRFGIKITSLADWAIITEEGIKSLKSNLQKAIDIAKQSRNN